MSPITPHNILRHELIGLEVRVHRSSDPTLISVRGKVVDETKNMIAIAEKGKRILVPKGTATLRFKLRDGTLVDVDGARLVARPENRLKMRARRW